MKINCKGKLLDLSIPRVMGILNVTPDSFFDGGNHGSIKDILVHVEKMLNEGADIIDIGGYSSRPGAHNVSIVEEIQRVVPTIESIIKYFPDIIISVDTFRGEVAKSAIEGGAAIINDISGGELDKSMFDIVAQMKVPYILMHMRGTPQTMQNNLEYDNIVKEIIYYFSEKVERLNKVGVHDIIIDPGFGFAKSMSQNFDLLSKLELFKMMELPILSGISRKSMIYKSLNILPIDSLNGTTALNMVSLMKGANILRVHDVKEARETVELYQLLSK